jgi:exopolyphosphatase/guanosine-5'-triphosphate,3'-diphosphate pyrophosphatase
MDTGGGSTEFVFGRAGRIVRKFSLNVGAVRFTEQYLSQMPVPADKLAAARAAIKKELEDGGVTGPVKFLVGMGGTVTSMAAVKHKMVKYNPEVIQGSVLTLDDVRAQIADYAAKTLDQRREIAGLQPKRADVILAGACIVEAVLELTGADRLTVSDRSLRHGLLYKLFKA